MEPKKAYSQQNQAWYRLAYRVGGAVVGGSATLRPGWNLTAGLEKLVGSVWQKVGYGEVNSVGSWHWGLHSTAITLFKRSVSLPAISNTTRPDQTVVSFGFTADEIPFSVQGWVELVNPGQISEIGLPVSAFDARIHLNFVPDEKPPPPGRKPLVVGVDVPEVVTHVSGDTKLVGNLRKGGLIEELWYGDRQVLEFAQLIPNFPKEESNGSQMQCDVAVEPFPGSPKPKGNLPLFATQGGQARRSGQIYQYEELQGGYRVLTRLGWWNFYKVPENVNSGISPWSDWWVEQFAELRQGHVRIRYTIWHESHQPQFVKWIRLHCFLIPTHFTGWEKVDGVLCAHGDLQLQYLGSFERNEAWWNKNWGAVEKDFEAARPQGAFSLQFKNDHRVQKTVTAGDEFTATVLVSRDIAEAIEVFEEHPDPPPVVKNIPVLDQSDQTFLVAQVQLDAALADGTLTIVYVQGIGMYKFGGTAAEFHEMYPTEDGEPPPPPPPNEIPVWPEELRAEWKGKTALWKRFGMYKCD